MQAFIYKRATDFPPANPAVAKRQGSFLGALYTVDFDAPPAPPAPEPPPPEPVPAEPVYGAAELAAAREEGLTAGRAESERGLAAARVRLLGEIAGGLAELQARAAPMAAEAAEAVARTMLSVLSACLPALCERHGAGEVTAILQALLPGLTQEQRIAVRVNPVLLASVAEELATLDGEVSGRVVVIPSERMPPGDVRVSWQDGAATRDGGRIRAAVNDALAALGLLEQEKIDA